MKTANKLEKIVMNHYPEKSREERINKVKRGTADALYNVYKYAEENYTHDTVFNEVFDDDILKYRDMRKNFFDFTSSNADIKKFSEINRVDYKKIFNLLVENLSPIFEKTASKDFFEGKLEIFLTCLAVSKYLKDNLLADDQKEAGNFFEEISLTAINRTLFCGVDFVEMNLLIAELPKILKLNYSAAKNIRTTCIDMIPKMLDHYRIYNPHAWKKFVDLKYLLDMLKSFELK